MKIIVTTNDAHDTYEGEDLTPLVNDRELPGQLDIIDGQGRVLGAYPAGRWDSVRVEGEGDEDQEPDPEEEKGIYDDGGPFPGIGREALNNFLNIGIPGTCALESEVIAKAIHDISIAEAGGHVHWSHGGLMEDGEPADEGNDEEAEDKPVAYVEVAPDLSKIKQFIRDLNDLVNKY